MYVNPLYMYFMQANNILRGRCGHLFISRKWIFDTHACPLIKVHFGQWFLFRWIYALYYYALSCRDIYVDLPWLSVVFMSLKTLFHTLWYGNVTEEGPKRRRRRCWCLRNRDHFYISNGFSQVMHLTRRWIYWITIRGGYYNASGVQARH